VLVFSGANANKMNLGYVELAINVAFADREDEA
jgi:hypothetical protein